MVDLQSECHLNKYTALCQLLLGTLWQQGIQMT